LKVHSDYLEHTNILLRKAYRYESNAIINSKSKVGENFLGSLHKVQENLMSSLVLINLGEESKEIPTMSLNICSDSSALHSNIEKIEDMSNKYFFKQLVFNNLVALFPKF
jgi:hypothetical protein